MIGLVFMNAFDGSLRPVSKPAEMSPDDFAKVGLAFSEGRGFDVAELALRIIKDHDLPDHFLVSAVVP